MSVTNISRALLEMSRIADQMLHPTNAGLTAMAGTKLALGPRHLLERIDGYRSIDQILAMSGDIVNVHATLGKLLAMGLVTPDPHGVATVPEVEAAPPPSPVEKPRAAAPARQATAPAQAVARAVTPVPTPTRPKITPAPTAMPAATASIAHAPKVIPAVTRPIAPATPVTTTPVSTTPAIAAKTILPSELDVAKRLLTLEAQHLMGNSAARMQPRIEACRSIAEIYDLIVKFRRHLSRTGTANPDVFLDRLTRGLEAARKSKPKPTATAA